MICGHCTNGVISEGASYYTCPFCVKKRTFIESVEYAIAILVAEDNLEGAKDLSKIHDLLESCPMLAVMEAEHQGLSNEFLDSMKQAFEIRKME